MIIFAFVMQLYLFRRCIILIIGVVFYSQFVLVHSRNHVTMGVSSVQHDQRRRGVIVTSVLFQNKGIDSLQPPLWVTHYLQPTLNSTGSSDVALQCYFELLGFLDIKRMSDIGVIQGAATLVQTQGALGKGVNCSYKNTFVQERLQGTSIPLIYYCPIHNESTCRAIIATSKKSKFVNYELFTRRRSIVMRTIINVDIRKQSNVQYHNKFSEMSNNVVLTNYSVFNKGVREWSTDSYIPEAKKLSWFEQFRKIVNLRRRALSFDHSSDKNGTVSVKHQIAVCLVLPYADADPIRKGILVEFIRWYHEVLGFKVIIHDRGGAHYWLLKTNNIFKYSKQIWKDYHNYTIFDLQKQPVRSFRRILDTDYDKVCAKFTFMPIVS